MINLTKTFNSLQYFNDAFQYFRVIASLHIVEVDIGQRDTVLFEQRPVLFDGHLIRHVHVRQSGTHIADSRAVIGQR